MTVQIGTTKQLPTWAATGNRVTPTDAKIDLGWQIGERPPAEHQNWLQNTIMQTVNRILRNGIPDWDVGTIYEANDFAKIGGSVYRALIQNVGSQPPSAAWVPVLAGVDLSTLTFWAIAIADVEHDAVTGRHTFPITAGQGARDALLNQVNGMVTIRSDKKLFEGKVGGAWFTDGIEVNARMLADQATAPYGFVQNVDVNDRVLRVVSDGTGGQVGGQWGISGISVSTAVQTSVSIVVHALTSDELPPDLTWSFQNVGVQAASGGGGTQVSNNIPSRVGGGAAHGHAGSTAASAAQSVASQDGNWRPAYRNVISVRKI
jgi:hypothetical protein